MSQRMKKAILLQNPLHLPYACEDWRLRDMPGHNPTTYSWWLVYLTRTPEQSPQFYKNLSGHVHPQTNECTSIWKNIIWNRKWFYNQHTKSVQTWTWKECFHLRKKPTCFCCSFVLHMWKSRWFWRRHCLTPWRAFCIYSKTQKD